MCEADQSDTNHLRTVLFELPVFLLLVLESQRDILAVDVVVLTVTVNNTF